MKNKTPDSLELEVVWLLSIKNFDEVLFKHPWCEQQYEIIKTNNKVILEAWNVLVKAVICPQNKVEVPDAFQPSENFDFAVSNNEW